MPVYQFEELPTDVSFKGFVIRRGVPNLIYCSSSFGSLIVFSVALVDDFVFIPTLRKGFVVMTG